MARILTVVALVAAAVATQVQADLYCQCSFQDGSHCCVYSDARFGDLDCTRWCRNAHRADGEGSDLAPGTACNADGKYSKVSTWNAQFRTPCYKQ